MQDIPELRETRRRFSAAVPPMRGINYGDNIQDGDLAESENLSTRRFPYLATRHGRTALSGYAGTTAIYRYKEQLLSVVGGELRVDGVKVANCSEGAKQFATVNTKVVMFPDKLMLDMESGDVTQMNVSLSLPANAEGAQGMALTSNSLVAPPFPVMIEGLENSFFMEEYNLPYLITYGTNPKTLDEAYESGDGAWDLDVDIRADKRVDAVSIGDIVMLNKTKAILTDTSDPVSTDDIDNQGYYGIVTRVRSHYAQKADVKIWYNVCSVNYVYEKFISFFNVNDAVEIRGTELGIADSKTARITEIDNSTNTITFESGAEIPYCYYALQADIGADTQFLLRAPFMSTGNRKSCTFYKTIKSGSVLVIMKQPTTEGEAFTIRIWKDGEYIDSFVTDTGVTTTGNPYQMLQYSPLVHKTLGDTQNLSLVVQRNIPDLDYICAHDNRLWGVNNADGTIYGSALGMPMQFYDYAGVSTDSWAVAVAGNGRFTGCCEYGDSVLFWKEERLYKLLGNTPDSYQLNDYVIPGVQEGAHGTQCIVDDVLIYKGRNGVYGYGGSVPTLLSERFGERRFTATAAGTDGERYYITLAEGDDKRLMVYDVRRGIWLREDNAALVSYALLHGSLHAAAEDGNVYLLDCGVRDPLTDMAFRQVEDEERYEITPLSWYAQYAPMYDAMDGRKTLHKLLVRAELRQDAQFTVKVRFGGGAWQKIGRVNRKRPDVYEFYMPPNRGDRYEIRIEGVGGCSILGIYQQIYIGSEA